MTVWSNSYSRRYNTVLVRYTPAQTVSYCLEGTSEERKCMWPKLPACLILNNCREEIKEMNDRQRVNVKQTYPGGVGSEDRLKGVSRDDWDNVVCWFKLMVEKFGLDIRLWAPCLGGGSRVEKLEKLSDFKDSLLKDSLWLRLGLAWHKIRRIYLSFNMIMLNWTRG